jgi:hypothetical protein
MDDFIGIINKLATRFFARSKTSFCVGLRRKHPSVFDMICLFMVSIYL